MRRWGWILVLLTVITAGVHAADATVSVHVWVNGEPVAAKAFALNEANILLIDIQPVLSSLGFILHRAPGSGELTARRGSDELTIRSESRWGRWRGKRIEFVHEPLLKTETLFAPLEVLNALNLGTRSEISGSERDIYIYDSLPGISGELQKASFWVGKLSNPDSLIVTGEALSEINRSNYRAGVYTVWEDLPDIITPEQWALLSKQLPPWDCSPLYDAAGHLVKADGVAQIRENMNLPAKGQSVHVAFGLTVQGCLLRGAPRDDIFTVIPGSLDFDELQVSSLEIGSGVAVAGSTHDGAWLLVDSPFGWGWVKREYVAIAPGKQWVRDYRTGGSRLVVIGDRVGIKTTNKTVFAQMGTDLPILRHEQGMYIVKTPQRSQEGALQWGEGKIAENELVRVGFLPFTQANLIQQSFKLIGEPYAWGDQRHGLRGRDCSRFIADVFRSMGVILPRNSYEQDKTGLTVLRFTPRMSKTERLKLVASLTPCGTILAMKSHVMLYLGSIEGVPYAIHSLYSYRVAGEKGEVKVKTNRVVLSRLDLGENTNRRSLLERLTNVVEVGNAPPPSRGVPDQSVITRE